MLNTCPINKTFGEKFFNVLSIFSLNLFIGLNGCNKDLFNFKKNDH